MKYNPFEYIRSEKDILKLVNTLIANTKGEGEKSSEDFWVKAERLYYCALIGYIWYEAPDEGKEHHNSFGYDKRVGSKKRTTRIIKAPLIYSLTVWKKRNRSISQ